MSYQNRVQYYRDRYKAQKCRILKTHKEWRRKNPEYYKRYLIKNRPALVRYYRKWCHNNKTKRDAIIRRHQETLSYKVRIHDRRAKKFGLGISDTAILARFLKGKKRFKCFYCGKIKVAKRRICHLEHLIPLSRGGLHTAHNIVLACAKCNLTKGRKLPNEFIKKGQLVLL